MKTVDFDRLASSAPLNADAAKAVSMRGEADLSLRLEDQFQHWECPQKTWPVPLGQQDYTGLKMGRLTVIGYYGAHWKKGYSLWLVRCVCGRYELRKGRNIRQPKPSTVHECRRCNKMAQLRRQTKRDAIERFSEVAK